MKNLPTFEQFSLQPLNEGAKTLSFIDKGNTVANLKARDFRQTVNGLPYANVQFRRGSDYWSPGKTSYAQDETGRKFRFAPAAEECGYKNTPITNVWGLVDDAGKTVAYWQGGDYLD